MRTKEANNIMSGIITFPTLAVAISAGFELLDRTADGYLVRARMADGWALALVPNGVATQSPEDSAGELLCATTR
jgi:hypothetical protein